MKVAALQSNVKWHDREANFATARRLALEAAQAGARLIVLPEMFATGFSMDTEVTAEPLQGPTPRFLRSLARELGLYLVGGFACQDGGGPPQNVALMVDPDGKDLALYPKIHQIAILDEHLHYAPGKLPCVFALEGFEAACFICYDLRFPELFRTVVDRCALMVVIASWPASRQLHWDVLLRARAIEGQCYVLGVNRVGEGGGLLFHGGSAIIDPSGEILAREVEREAVVMGEIYPDRVLELRSTMPFLKDRKAHLFQMLAQRYLG